MYLNIDSKKLKAEQQERLTLTLDVFKYWNLITIFPFIIWLTLTLDVFKYFCIIKKW